MRFKLFVAALVTTLGLLLAGCGATQGTATSTATPEASSDLGDNDVKGSWDKACDLLTKKDAQDVYDAINTGRIVDGQPSNDNYNDCAWNDSIANGIMLHVNAYGNVDDANSQLKTLLETRKTYGRLDKAINVPGASQAWQHCGVFTSVAFLKGTTIAEVTLELNPGYMSSASYADDKTNGCVPVKKLVDKIASRI